MLFIDFLQKFKDLQLAFFPVLDGLMEDGLQILELVVELPVYLIFQFSPVFAHCLQLLAQFLGTHQHLIDFLLQFVLLVDLLIQNFVFALDYGLYFLF